MFVNSGIVPALAANSLSFTPAEKSWLKQHSIIRIGVDAGYAPYSFKANDGSYQGVALDYLVKLEQSLGLRFEIVPDLSWPQIIEGAKERTLDAIATAVKTPERESFLGFTGIYIPTPLVIMTQIDNTSIGNAIDLNHKTVALVREYSSSQRITEEHPEINPYFVETPLDGLLAVAGGNAEAYVGVIGVNTYLMSKHGITNLKVASGYEMQTNGQRIGVRSDWPELVSILDKALNALPEHEKLSVLSKWIPIQNLIGVAVEEQKVDLSEEEQRWLADHREMRLAVDPDFAPVEFIDERGNFSGIASEYVKIINQRLGISLQVVSGLTWSESVELARRGQIDVFSAITPTDERKQYLNFTEPYFRYPIVIFTRSDYPFVGGLESFNDKKVAVVKDYVTHELTRVDYPEVQLLVVDSIHEGLDAVSTGKVDAYIGVTATASYNIRKYNYTNLKIAAPTSFRSPGLAFGVRKDWPLLPGILNKTLDTISLEERLRISKNWIEIEVEEFPKHWIWISEAAAVLLLLFIIISSILRYQVRKRTLELSDKNIELRSEVAERKRIQEALIESERRLSQFFHGTFEMVFFHDKGVILDVNPAAKDTTGYDSDELVGRNILEFVDQGSQKTVLENMAAEYEAPYEICIKTKKGAVLPVEIHAKSIDIGGYHARVVSLRDITERRKHEMELQKAHDVLEDKVEERTYELVEANEKLKELDRLKSMFIASVSHELRTPLNSIIGFSSMMMRQSFGDLNEKYKDYASRINNSGQHLLALITDIIDLSKIESGRIDVEVSEFTLDDVVTEAVNDIKTQAERKKLLLQVEVPGGIVVNSDRRRLLQCLLNFLSNAVKYSEKGSIHVSAESSSTNVKLSVRDTGIGIGKEDMPRLFSAFERIDSHLRVKAGGTGLGLYLTQKIARDMLKGEVGVESETGRGSVFWIRFPATLTVPKVIDNALA
ncbi:MAG: transporter substrate-binding domain-containing protein [Gammaproteobacteria bacterium]|jgi:PAS domain S-box-containing protein